MTTSQLRYFMIAAQLENLSAAAASLYITQSSLSKNIASLEKELGIRLFDRKGKSIKLNEAGAQFLAACQKMLGELDGAMADIRQHDWKAGTRIRIGVEGEPGPLFSWMGDFRHMHPEVVFEIDSSLGAQEHPDINEYDVMIYPDRRKYSKFKGFPFYTEDFYMAVPSGDPLIGREPISNRDLGGRDFVFLRYGVDSFEAPREVWKSLVPEPHREHLVDSECLKRKMIAEGIASGFVSAENADLYRTDRQIWLLPLVSGRFSRQMMICFKREKHLTDLAAAFCRYVSSCASLPADAI